ncbi:MAG TPA: 2Fe-2S iron-sulfur cluster-binding protein [Chryseolinea sp.]|nr:2Fe-2S iron-sulfur cluster-binding protein [Chryseolinea sp.]
MIIFDVVDSSGNVRTVEVPEGINLNLMEVLKASEYPILATCGGMALCATCQVEVAQGIENLPSPTDVELDMLDQLPRATTQSRLACQIKIRENLNGAIFNLASA